MTFICIQCPIIFLGISILIWVVGLFWNPFDKKKKKSKYNGYGTKNIKRKSLVEEGHEHKAEKATEMALRRDLISAGVNPSKVSNSIALREKQAKIKSRGYNQVGSK